MEKQKHTQTLIIAVLAVAVLTMSIGFAATAYTQALNINGADATVKASKWSVHFDDTSYAETTGSVAASSHTLNTTTLTYAVTLEKPGDFYEATVNVVNDGTFDANLKSIVMNAPSAAQSNYVNYSIIYNGTTYTATNNAITGVTLPKSTGTHPVKVRIEYVQPADDANLPTTDQTITLTATLNYEQVQ